MVLSQNNGNVFKKKKKRFMISHNKTIFIKSCVLIFHGICKHFIQRKDDLERHGWKSPQWVDIGQESSWGPLCKMRSSGELMMT